MDPTTSRFLSLSLPPSSPRPTRSQRLNPLLTHLPTSPGHHGESTASPASYAPPKPSGFELKTLDKMNGLSGRRHSIQIDSKSEASSTNLPLPELDQSATSSFLSLLHPPASSPPPSIPTPLDTQTLVPPQTVHDPYIASRNTLLSPLLHRAVSEPAIPSTIGGRPERDVSKEMMRRLKGVQELQREIGAMHNLLEGVGGSSAQVVDTAPGEAGPEENLQPGGEKPASRRASIAPSLAGSSKPDPAPTEKNPPTSPPSAGPDLPGEAKEVGASELEEREKSVLSIISKLSTLSHLLKEFHALPPPTLHFPAILSPSASPGPSLSIDVFSGVGFPFAAPDEAGLVASGESEVGTEDMGGGVTPTGRTGGKGLLPHFVPDSPVGKPLGGGAKVVIPRETVEKTEGMEVPGSWEGRAGLGRGREGEMGVGGGRPEVGRSWSSVLKN